MVKSFVGILVGAIITFLAGAMIQEWEVFAQPWFQKPDDSPALSEQEQSAALDTVFLFLKLSSHLYGTGGDTRFAERIPASPAIIAEITDEIRYLSHIGLVEDPVLKRLEVVSINATSPTRAEITTREFWIVRRYRRGDSEPLSTRSDIVFVRYRLTKNDRWSVVSWDPTELPREDSPS